MYSIELRKMARKSFLKLPKLERQRISCKLRELASSPLVTHLDVKALRDYEGYYRLRVGNYRVIYELQHMNLIIEVIKIAHRKEVYQ